MKENTSLISDSYRELNKKLHDSNASYGSNGHRWAKTIRYLVQENNLQEILDYGCGKQTLKKSLTDSQVYGYDPAFPELAQLANPADLVFCGDVLEHIEPDYLEAVLDDLQRVTKKLGFFVISTRPAKKTLADGRNAHISLLPVSEWAILLAKRFNLVAVIDYLPEFDKQSLTDIILDKLKLNTTGFNSIKPQKGEVIFLVSTKKGITT